MAENKSIIEFQEKVCKNDCILKGRCLENLEYSDHWYKSCPHWFYYYNDIPYSYVHDCVKAQYENPNKQAKTWEKPRKRTKQ